MGTVHNDELKKLAEIYNEKGKTILVPVTVNC